MANRLQVPMGGPLARYAPGFRAELERLGYAARTVAPLMALVGQLSAWLESRGLDEGGLTPEVVESFLRRLHDGGGWFRPTARTLASLLGYLRELGVTPEPVPSSIGTPLEELIGRYRGYLLGERGLAEGTVDYYIDAARLFLSGQRPIDRLDWEHLSLGDVVGFATRECPRRSVGSAKNLLTGLRSLLRFMQLEGLTTAPLAQAVPSAAGWRGSALPRALRPGEATRMLASCERRRATGRRDYAILVLLVRLGLRAGEVAALTLKDLDWRAGEIVIRGKGRSLERLPLPADVGEAVVAYLRHGRPDSADRAVFLRAHAPLRGLSSGGVAEVVRTAGERAGLPGVGAHRLRHTAATEMLRAGAPLSEVAQVLRHRSAATTAIYAKVDHIALATLALPWPAGAR